MRGCAPAGDGIRILYVAGIVELAICVESRSNRLDGSHRTLSPAPGSATRRRPIARYDLRRHCPQRR